MKHRTYFLFLAILMLNMLLSCTTETTSPGTVNSDNSETGETTATAVPLTSTPVSEPEETPTLEPVVHVEEQKPIPTSTQTFTPTPTPTIEFIPITSGPFTLVSVSSSGEQGNGASFDPAISADGRYIVFASEATNLMADDKNGVVTDVFLHDRVTGQTILISKSSKGEQGAGHSRNPSISGDGHYIVFASDAWNIVDSEDKNSGTNVYLYDRQTEETTLVSAPVAGSDHGNWDTRCPVVSTNGRYIAFISEARNLTEKYVTGVGEPLKGFHLFVHDRELGVTQMIPVLDEGGELLEIIECPRISSDGRYVASLIEGAVSLMVRKSMFVYDMNTLQTTLIMERNEVRDFSLADGLVAFSDDGIFVTDFAGNIKQINDEQLTAFQPNLSADGQHIVFWSGIKSGVGSETIESWTLYTYDLGTETLETLFFAPDIDTVEFAPATGGTPVSQAFSINDERGRDVELSPVISSDGKVVAFVSNRPDLVTEQGTGATDIFIYQIP